MAKLYDDLRFALRSMWKRPGFFVLIISALAICIGANTAIFSIVDAVLLRALPFHDPGRLVSVSEKLSNIMVGVLPFSAPDYEELVRRNHSFVSLGIYRDRHFELSGVNRPERLDGDRISASLFPTLGIAPALDETSRRKGLERASGRHPRCVPVAVEIRRRSCGCRRSIVLDVVRTPS